jgi:hypothetical protein|tara:strand:- start:417 stop:734 length:318 start_codon:yes stop_codon:yes gene_type:complete
MSYIRKFIALITGQKNHGSLTYKVLDPGAHIKKNYQNSVGWFFTESKKVPDQYPKGIWWVGGGDDYISASYDIRLTNEHSVCKFIEQFGISVELATHTKGLQKII